MTALELVPPLVGVVVGESNYYLSADYARRLTDDIREHLTSALSKLGEAREGHAHLALGYPDWHTYCEREFGDLRELRLPLVERRALVASMTRAELPVRQQVAKIGFSVGTIHGDQVALGLVTPKLTAVEDVCQCGGTMGAHYADCPEVAPEPEPAPIDGLPKTVQIPILARRQGDRGITCLEVEEEQGWRHGVASGPFSTVARRGEIVPTGEFRLGYGVYVAGPTLEVDA